MEKGLCALSAAAVKAIEDAGMAVMSATETRFRQRPRSDFFEPVLVGDEECLMASAMDGGSAFALAETGTVDNGFVPGESLYLANHLADTGDFGSAAKDVLDSSLLDIERVWPRVSAMVDDALSEPKTLYRMAADDRPSLYRAFSDHDDVVDALVRDAAGNLTWLRPSVMDDFAAASLGLVPLVLDGEELLAFPGGGDELYARLDAYQALVSGTVDPSTRLFDDGDEEWFRGRLPDTCLRKAREKATLDKIELVLVIEDKKETKGENDA